MGAMTTNSIPMIQASSLANIISIADSPPSKPSARRHGGRPLELYIARVPGSRDIFLTTLKPRDKVVTAQDVESCLYYCHLESENDDLFRHEDDYFGEHDGQEIRSSSISSQDEPASPTSQARGPPLPPLHASDMESSFDSLNIAPMLPPRPDDAGPVTAVRRKPLHSNANDLHHETAAPAPTLPPRPVPMPMPVSAPPLSAPNLPPRPMGPRPLADRRPSENNVAQVPPIVTEFRAQHQLQKPTEIPRRPVSIPSSSPHLGGSQLPYPVTPTDGFGKENIHNFPWTPQSGVFSPSVPLHNSSNQILPAYTKDSSRPQLPPRPAPLSPRSPNSANGRNNSLVANIPAGFHNAQHPSSHPGFNVTLIRRNPSDGTQLNVGKITIPAVAPGSRSQSKALLQIFTPSYSKFRASDSVTTASLVRCISEDDDCTFSTDLRLATRRRSIKSPTSPYYGDVPVNQLLSVTPSQPYSFLSPWNRVCEFFTGVGGRSLKCRHMLARGNVLDEDPNSMNPCALSELRFNTPSTRLWNKGGERKGAEKRRPVSAISRKSVPFHNAVAHAANHGHHASLPVNRYSQDSGGPSTFTSGSGGDGTVFEDDVDWDVEPMDLSLGQERAGGGLKGNKAKLGKLVVEPEGLEMLDLLVAANMGIWWSIR